MKCDLNLLKVSKRWDKRWRVQDIKRAAARKQQWLAAGHGEYREAATEKDFFAEVKGEERAVCHFYRNSWPCKVGHACRPAVGDGPLSQQPAAWPRSRPVLHRPVLHHHSLERCNIVSHDMQRCHLYQSGCFMAMQVMDKHMQQLAVSHVETKFIKVPHVPSFQQRVKYSHAT